jgi:YesN/AraC family two-component response regulator
MIIDCKEDCQNLTKFFEGVEQVDVVATCIDGEDAIDTAISCEPDIVVTDVILPEKDGFELSLRAPVSNY